MGNEKALLNIFITLMKGNKSFNIVTDKCLICFCSSSGDEVCSVWQRIQLGHPSMTLLARKSRCSWYGHDECDTAYYYSNFIRELLS